MSGAVLLVKARAAQPGEARRWAVGLMRKGACYNPAVMSGLVALRKAADAPPGDGWGAIPGGSKGGRRRLIPGKKKYEYWYPGAGVVEKKRPLTLEERAENLRTPVAVDDRLALLKVGVTRFPPPGVAPESVKVRLSADPASEWMISWTDAAGRSVRSYTAACLAHNAEGKWKRIEKWRPKIGKIRASLLARVGKGKPGTPEHQSAVAAALMAFHGLRPGSDDMVTGHFGVLTLRAEHVKPDKSGAVVEFVGKSGVVNRREVTEPVLAKGLLECTARAGDAGIFAGATHDSVRTLLPEGMKIKDLRTVYANEVAERAISDFKGPPPPLPEAPAKAKSLLTRALKAMSAVVSDALNNTPSVARANYIHPRLFADWARAVGGAAAVGLIMLKAVQDGDDAVRDEDEGGGEDIDEFPIPPGLEEEWDEATGEAGSVALLKAKEAQVVVTSGSVVLLKAATPFGGAWASTSTGSVPAGGKRRGAPPGTRRRWGGSLYEKQASGEWTPVHEGAPRRPSQEDEGDGRQPGKGEVQLTGKRKGEAVAGAKKEQPAPSGKAEEAEGIPPGHPAALALEGRHAADAATSLTARAKALRPPGFPAKHEPHAQAIETALAEFGAGGTPENPSRVIGISDAGPRLTEYVIAPGKGVRTVSLLARRSEVSRALGRNARVAEDPASGNVVVQVPRVKADGKPDVRPVPLSEAMQGATWEAATKAEGVPCPIGVDSKGNPVAFNLSRRMPGVIVAGASGSGKSVAMHSMVAGMLSSRSPEDLRVAFIDPKGGQEFSRWASSPHAWGPVAGDAATAVELLDRVVNEMEARFRAPKGSKFPDLVVVVDEVADLMGQDRRGVGGKLKRISQKARSAGIYMILGTQRPAGEDFPRDAAANYTTRLVGKVADSAHAKAAGVPGADKVLEGSGDFILKDEGGQLIRLQAAHDGSDGLDRVAGDLGQKWRGSTRGKTATEAPSRLGVGEKKPGQAGPPGASGQSAESTVDFMQRYASELEERGYGDVAQRVLALTAPAARAAEREPSAGEKRPGLFRRMLGFA